MGDFKIGRRSLLAGSGAILSVMASGVRVQAQESVTALPDYVSWKDADALIVHSNSTIEMGTRDPVQSSRHKSGRLPTYASPMFA